MPPRQAGGQPLHPAYPLRVFCVSAILLAASSAGMSPVRAEPPRFAIVAPGIAYATFAVRPADSEPFSGHAFKIDLDVSELRLVPAGDSAARRTVEQIVAPYPVVVAVNASFFDKEGRAMGLAVDTRRMGGAKRAGGCSWQEVADSSKGGLLGLPGVPDVRSPIAPGGAGSSAQRSQPGHFDHEHDAVVVVGLAPHVVEKLAGG